MRELNQGEEYKEDDYDDEEELDESSEDTNAQISTIFGIPKLYFFIGLAVLVIVILLLVLFLFRNKSSTEMSSEVSDILSNSEAGESTGDGSYSWSPDGDDASSDVDTEADSGEDTGAETAGSDDAESEKSYTGAIKLYDATGNLIGTCDSTNEGDVIYDLSAEVVGSFSKDGTLTAYDENKKSLGTYQIYEDDETTDNSYVNKDLTDTGETNLLDADELHYQMRAYGYTADEIDMAVDMGITVDQLEAEAKAAQDVKAAEALKRMSKHSSKEFRSMKKYSIFCMPKVKFDNVKKSKVKDDYDTSYIVNADYEKCPTNGLQLFIKVKIANKTYAFMTVTPSRWKELPDTGNIVVQVSLRVYGAEHVNTYVTGIQEIDTTKITVNPSDSGSSMSQILKESDVDMGDTETEETETEEDDKW